MVYNERGVIDCCGVSALYNVADLHCMVPFYITFCSGSGIFQGSVGLIVEVWGIVVGSIIPLCQKICSGSEQEYCKQKQQPFHFSISGIVCPANLIILKKCAQ